MEAVMNCQQGAAHLFIENIYMLLTDSMIPRSASLTNPLLSFAPEELVPHFALPTTSHVIKRIAESPLKARMVVESHKDFIRELRGIHFLVFEC